MVGGVRQEQGLDHRAFGDSLWAGVHETAQGRGLDGVMDIYWLLEGFFVLLLFVAIIAFFAAVSTFDSGK